MKNQWSRAAALLVLISSLSAAGGCSEDENAAVEPPACPLEFKAAGDAVIGAATGDVADTVEARICSYDVSTDNEFSGVIHDELVPSDVLEDILDAVRRGERDSGYSDKPGACGEDGMRQYWFFGVTAQGEGTVMGATDCAFLPGVPPESPFGRKIA